MIIANEKTMAEYIGLREHFDEEMVKRQEFEYIQNQMESLGRFDPKALAVNAAMNFDSKAWLSIDNGVASYIENARGTEVYEDLKSVITVLPLGKTVRMWNNVGTIHDEIAISMDGQSPAGADQVTMSADGDPVPLFVARAGINYRHELANRTEGVNLLGDSVNAKMDVFLAGLAQYTMSGSERISEAGFKGEGVTNHRNTEKMDLGTNGFNVDLTTADQAALVKFFTVDFSGVLDDNNVQTVDLWVSKEIRANLSNDFTGSNIDQTIEQYVMRRNPRIASIRTSYNSDVPAFDTGLTGNEILAYVKTKGFIEMLVGQSIQTVPVPRLGLRENFNVDISAAMGISVKRRGANSGVFFGASLT